MKSTDVCMRLTCQASILLKYMTHHSACEFHVIALAKLTPCTCTSYLLFIIYWGDHPCLLGSMKWCPRNALPCPSPYNSLRSGPVTLNGSFLHVDGAPG